MVMSFIPGDTRLSFATVADREWITIKIFPIGNAVERTVTVHEQPSAKPPGQRVGGLSQGTNGKESVVLRQDGTGYRRQRINRSSHHIRRSIRNSLLARSNPEGAFRFPFGNFQRHQKILIATAAIFRRDPRAAGLPRRYRDLQNLSPT